MLVGVTDAHMVKKDNEGRPCTRRGEEKKDSTHMWDITNEALNLDLYDVD